MAGPLIPLLGVVAEFIVGFGARAATRKYGAKAVSEGMKQVKARQSAISKRVETQRMKGEIPPKGQTAAQREGLRKADLKKRLDKEQPKSKVDLEGEPLDEIPLEFAEGGSVNFPDLTGDGKITRADVLKGRGVFAEGGDVNSQMEMLLGGEEMPMEEPMVSDETMESDYLDFILDEALDEEEEDFLMEQLESNDKLSLIFDKVIDVATEFAGSGPVNGPGSGVSDSIPARLSDGEFVFTAKATEEIGADNLEAMMKEAEANAEGRQQVAEGGEIEEESVEMPVQAAQQQNIRVSRPTVSALAARQEQKDIVGDEIKKRMMLDPNQKHVRS